MNVIPENIIVNSCEYTPIYLIQTPGVTQAGSYIIAESYQEDKPVTDNLKRFYENSGSLENNLFSSSKPRILKKQNNVVGNNLKQQNNVVANNLKQQNNIVGNNLKLASFLLPKVENVQNVTNVQNVANIQNVTSVQNVANIQNVTSVQNVANIQNVTSVQNVANIQNVTSVQNVANIQNVTSVQNVANIQNLTNVANTQKPVALSPVPMVTQRVEKGQPVPIAVSNMIVRPAAPVTIENGTLPRVEINRKIVRVGTIPNKIRPQPRPLPKMKPKEKVDPNPSKHTSVQLLKLGETYHSLNQLSEEQMKIVTKALKIFGNPDNTPKEPAYDPVTNTKFIYKVVSPRDLTVVGKNKMKKKAENKKQAVKKTEEVVNREPEVPEEEIKKPKVTRSGRTVKLLKQIQQGSPEKPKRKFGNVIRCFQCSAEFSSLYRLQRHYEHYPTHIPARIHSNLFHCLLAIIKGGSSNDQANIFIQQLEQLIERIKSLLPCLLKKIDGKEGMQCTIKDEIGRLLGMTPGKYKLNIDALNCIKDKDGHCVHNPAPKNQISADTSKPSQRLSKTNEEISNMEAESEDCARINSVDKWPTTNKRTWKVKQQKSQNNAKRIRLASESDQLIELGVEDFVLINQPEESAINVATNDVALVENNIETNENVNEQVMPVSDDNPTSISDQSNKPKPQFHSTHFDIRSSPIKLPSALVRKFQLNPNKMQKMTSFEVQILKPLVLEQDNNVEENQSVEDNSSITFEVMMGDNGQIYKTEMNDQLNFDNTESWEDLTESNVEPEESYLESNFLLEMDQNKPNDVIRSSLVDNSDKNDSSIESSFILKDVSALFDTADRNILHIKENTDGFFDPATPNAKTPTSTVIDPSMIHVKDERFEAALASVRERSNNLFEPTILRSENKSRSLVETSKANGLYDSTSHLNGRSNSLYASNLVHKDKDSLIGPSLIHIKEINRVYSNELIEPMMCNTLSDKCNGLEQSMQSNIDENHVLSTSDSKLLESQNQNSVFNFLESLGNESLGLSYPETDIRNSSVDFQLDLFSFNTS